ncbi:MAG: DUF1573 domain-containing protein [Bacteroides sp.]|nr:DUF1573 domain-containing protein [Bacteroides sp.]
MRNLITATYLTLLAMLSACAPSAKERNTALVAEWVGRELIIPDELVYTIMGDTIDYDPLDADYTIVAYIDSAGCTECRMKLNKWEEIIAQMNSDPTIDVNFLMVVDSPDVKEAIRVQKRGFFDYPLAIDNAALFKEANRTLPDNEMFHVFLLDSSGSIVAIGSPVLNPNLLKLYLKTAGVEAIVNDIPMHTDVGMKSVGVLADDDSTVVKFTLRNSSSQPVEISGIVESCACMDAQADSQIIPTDGKVEVSITIHGDTATVRNSAQVFFTDTEQPLLLKTISYAKKQPAASQAAPRQPKY